MLNTKPLYSKGIIRDRKMLTQSQFSQVKFSAILNNYVTFYNVAKAINFVDVATVQLTNDGMKVVVEDAKSVQATAYVMRNCFSEYKLAHVKRKLGPADVTDDDEPSTSFGLNLKAFTDCLSMFLESEYDSHMKMVHKGDGAPLVAILEQGEDYLITECSVKTMESPEVMDFDFDKDNVCSQVTVNGALFFALLSELDRNCDEIEVLLSPDSPSFKLSTFGELHSESNIEITDDSEMLISFQSTETTSHRYKFSHFKLVMGTLALASKVSLRTNKDGLLGMQVMIEISDSSQLFVEYFIVPLCESNQNNLPESERSETSEMLDE
ncbi:cell cycle checkpoint protein RAD1 [Topomyia yanbarensis]|uniref:cell cycle checkpoint protein RAD1 n=1 Tax=Topomyia yanbarensis TaxID=2498891 RepID=UPI00273B9D2C|nr:cell cycle checkpoint protein RAD1 [Topomyia yanbarensis]